MGRVFPKRMNQIKTFICHSSKDKKVAGLFKAFFERYFGFEVFLAHEDIPPSAEWDSEILMNLKKSDLFIPLISADFEKAIFANQEIGMAIAWGIKIIPIKIDNTNPCGFISKLQAYKCRDSSVDELLKATTTIFFLIIEDPRFSQHYKSRAVDSILCAFSDSDCFRTTRIILKTLIKTDEKLNFHKGQVKSMVEAINQNNQINNELYVLPKFKKLLENKYQVKIDI